ncbi:helix-turn-helix transcriptional regulator [uncultured Stenotrophomonas sp.]|uniref:helix-turn-helix domain-containing protein n=1 Tax=uncultured Stenotrophomonas sp. TaxID=165438 RepID=UPI0025D9C2C3|nr:helix-turn-helix transcriptional regulator [uncultured Stenotrophomonas sp.]
MQTLSELGLAVAERRRALGLTQIDVAAQAGVASDTLSRFELGKATDFGARKLLAVLAVLGMEMEYIPEGHSGSLDSLALEQRLVHAKRRR